MLLKSLCCYRITISQPFCGHYETSLANINSGALKHQVLVVWPQSRSRWCLLPYIFAETEFDVYERRLVYREMIMETQLNQASLVENESD